VDQFTYPDSFISRTGTRHLVRPNQGALPGRTIAFCEFTIRNKEIAANSMAAVDECRFCPIEKELAEKAARARRP
jgi:hypothetical protein